MVSDSIFYVLVIALPVIALAIVVAVIFYIRRNGTNTNNTNHLISPPRYDPGSQPNQFVITDSPMKSPSDPVINYPHSPLQSTDISLSLSPSYS
jgi:hypothetical protein